MVKQLNINQGGTTEVSPRHNCYRNWFEFPNCKFNWSRKINRNEGGTSKSFPPTQLLPELVLLT